MRDDSVRDDDVLQYASPRTGEAVKPPVPPSPPATAPGLSPEQMRAIEQSRILFKPLRRVRSIAKFDAVTLAIFAGITLLSGYSSASGLFIGLSLSACAFFEFKAISSLDRLEDRSLKWLAMNQIALGSALIIYAVWNLLDAHFHPEKLVGELDSGGDLGQLGFDLKGLAQTIMYLLYGSLIVIAFAVQGSSAIYYMTRRKYLHRYVTEVPDWARKI